jgi:hypothetical protein
MSDLLNDTKKHTTKSRETIPLKTACLKATVRRVAHPSMEKKVLQIRRILLRLGSYFPDCDISGKVPWVYASVSARLWYPNSRTTIA